MPAPQGRSVISFGKFEQIRTDDGDIEFVGTLNGNRAVLSRDPDTGLAKRYWSLTLEGRIFTLPARKRRIKGPLPEAVPGFPDQRK